MKKYAAILLVIIAAAVLPSQGIEPDPLYKAAGARPIALGNAFVGLSDDGSALFLNPAGITKLKQISGASMYTKPASDTTFASFGISFPNVWGGTSGAGYRNKTISGIAVSTETISYFDQDLSFVYAKNLRPNFSLGGKLRLISKSPSKDIPGTETTFGSGNALDLSFKYNLRPWLNLGGVFQNLGGKIGYRGGKTDTLPQNTILGSSFLVLGWDGLIKNPKQQAYVNFDISKIPSEPYLMHLGIEWWPAEMMALRFGIDQSAQGQGAVFQNITSGIGLRFRNITFDYAFYRQGDASQATTYYFSLGYLEPKSIIPSSLFFPTPESTIVIKKLKRIHFTDVLPGFPGRNAIETLAAAGIMSGEADGNFYPSKKITNLEFSKLLSKAKNTLYVKPSMPDIFITRKSAAKALGIKGKIPRPLQPLTRADAAEFLFETPFVQSAIRRLPPLDE